MDPLRFDRLARRLAVVSSAAEEATATPTRRQVLRGAVAGVVSTVALARSPRHVAAELCPERVPRRNYQPTINGCGPSGYGWVVKDTYGDANFTPACNQHDRCYGTCNESRMKCDFLLRKSMQKACKRAYPGKANTKIRHKCNGRARFYFNVVSNNGLSAFEDAQNEACICCQADKVCGDTCCPDGYECCGNQCRPSDLGPWDACAVGGFCCPSPQTCCGGENGTAACCGPDHICVANCIGAASACCHETNPDCCNISPLT